MPTPDPPSLQEDPKSSLPSKALPLSYPTSVIYRCSGPSPFKGEVRRGMGVFFAPELPHPHPNPPLEGEGVFQRKIDANQG